MQYFEWYRYETRVGVSDKLGFCDKKCIFYQMPVVSIFIYIYDDINIVNPETLFIMKAISFLFATFLLSGYGIFFSSCAEKTSNASAELSLKELYKDSVYLEIKGDLNDPEIIWGNVKTYLPAFYRMTRHSRLQNNQVVFDCQSAEELKISPNIYEYLMESFRQTNQQAIENGWQIVEEYDGYGVVYKFNRSPKN